MLRDVVGYLRCPHCTSGLDWAPGLEPAPGMLACARGHSFDVARQGYVSLLPGDARPGTADTPAMVDARAAFLAGGHYASLAAAVASECARLLGGAVGVIVDVGAGTGYHLTVALDRSPGAWGVALDVSKHAARRAARAHPRIGAVVCDAWRPLPVQSGSATVVLSVFAPKNGPEMRRVLCRGGALVAVTPTAEHLAELVAPLGLLSVDERKDERLEQSLGGSFQLDRQTFHSQGLALDRRDIGRLVGMGPSAHHTDAPTTRARIEAMPAPITVTVSCVLSVYRPRLRRGRAGAPYPARG